MKIFMIFIGILLSIVIILGLAGVTYLEIAYPKVRPAKQITITATPAMIEHGRYMANHITPCMDCHSQRNWKKFSAPIFQDSRGMGGEKFDQDYGLPGIIYAPNITPASIGNWTDGEVYHAITTGVTKDGRPLFPIMPYLSFAKMAPYDVESIITYLRTLKPIANTVPAPKIKFPMNLIMRTIPTDAQPMEKPAPNDTVAYGKYLVTIAACSDCHTPMHKGQPIDSLSFAGGFKFRLPTGGIVRSANITPDSATGIGLWSENQFVNTFKKFDIPTDSLQNVLPNHYNTVMPWTFFAGMQTSDLRSIYQYLRTIHPVKHHVVRFIPDKP